MLLSPPARLLRPRCSSCSHRVAAADVEDGLIVAMVQLDPYVRGRIRKQLRPRKAGLLCPQDRKVRYSRNPRIAVKNRLRHVATRGKGPSAGAFRKAGYGFDGGTPFLALREAETAERHAVDPLETTENDRFPAVFQPPTKRDWTPRHSTLRSSLSRGSCRAGLRFFRRPMGEVGKSEPPRDRDQENP